MMTEPPRSPLRRAAVLVRTAAYVTHSAVVAQLRNMAAKAGMVSISFTFRGNVTCRFFRQKSHSGYHTGLDQGKNAKEVIDIM